MFEQLLFSTSAFLTVVGAMAVVFTPNLIHACIYLFVSLIGVAGLYLTLSADFVAATQLVVYVGGVVILMLFAIMLTGGTSQKANEVNKFGLESIPAMGNGKTYGVAALAVIVFSLVTGKLLLKVLRGHVGGELPPYESTVEQLGIKLVTDHILVFEISSVLLLGALVGAAIIARPKKVGGQR